MVYAFLLYPRANGRGIWWGIIPLGTGWGYKVGNCNNGDHTDNEQVAAAAVDRDHDLTLGQVVGV